MPKFAEEGWVSVPRQTCPAINAYFGKPRLEWKSLTVLDAWHAAPGGKRRIYWA
ncbi:MAG: hypothetical protein U1E91_01860 [Moraxella sp.]